MSLFTKGSKRQILELPVSSIYPNPHQPRQHFDAASLRELSRSIAHAGVIQPLSVRRTAAGWELIAGERRWRAAQMAGLLTVPCIPVQTDDEQSSLLALIENIQREDLDVWEEAAALQKIIQTFGLSQEETGRRVGISQSAVANKLRLLKLPEDVIEGLRQANLTERHARALLRLSSPELQRSALHHIIQCRLNVAATERYVDKLCLSSPKQKQAVPIYRTRDVRLFLNTIHKGLAIMQSAGVNARCDKEETDREIALTIYIPK